MSCRACESERVEMGATNWGHVSWTCQCCRFAWIDQAFSDSDIGL